MTIKTNKPMTLEEIKKLKGKTNWAKLASDEKSPNNKNRTTQKASK
ncbi:MAG: hypothetical protein OEZ58_16610 [Gammaproteobacteria bacterium]|nr:hypothetical protein [Gammaproteobacteria bacterium]